MKNLNKLIMIAVLLSLLTSCEEKFELSQEFAEGVELEDMWEAYGKTRGWLTTLYADLPTYRSNCEGYNFAVASGDAATILDVDNVNNYNNGVWSKFVTLDFIWSGKYNKIRQANIFIENAVNLTFPKEKSHQDYLRRMESASYFLAEARFLRANMYFELFKRYGGVPLILDEISFENASKVSKASAEDIVKFVLAELDDVKDKLPTSYVDIYGNETGRITNGAAYALKARLLLYWASPLWNESNDLTRYEKAAKACQDIMGLGQYELEESYSDILNNMSSTEMILERREGFSNSFEFSCYPVGGDFYGNSKNTPTQNLVDCYEMKETGLRYDNTESGYDENNPYDGRDPRFYETVFYNQSVLRGDVINAYNGGEQGYQIINGSKTGYYLKKGLRTDVNTEPGNTSEQLHIFSIFRLGEVYLNYAEAMNEAYGPMGKGGLTYSAHEAVNALRQKRGMPIFDESLTKEDFRLKLRNERRVELAFEGHRFFDIRRWKIGTESDVLGMKVEKEADGSFTYNRYVLRKNKWEDHYVLYPIPHNELVKNKNLQQNPNW